MLFSLLNQFLKSTGKHWKKVKHECRMGSAEIFESSRNNDGIWEIWKLTNIIFWNSFFSKCKCRLLYKYWNELIIIIFNNYLFIFFYFLAAIFPNYIWRSLSDVFLFYYVQLFILFHKVIQQNHWLQKEQALHKMCTSRKCKLEQMKHVSEPEYFRFKD